MKRGKDGTRFTTSIACVLCLFFALPVYTAAYSVLSHEAIIDSTWDTNIRPLLLRRFPGATADELKQAHGYAYGGVIIQDLGYYPHGNRFFSDLTHYVRSGDFVVALLRDAKDLNGYAFALGAMSHYAADNNGHRIATNRAVPILYPKLQRKFGDEVTYEQGPLEHLKTEFAFDVLEVARGRFASDAYHDFIGFAVAVPLLEQAFRETYGLELNTLFTDEEKTFESYRYNVSQLFPKATRIAWSINKDDIIKDQPGITKQKFLYNLSRSSYQKNWGNKYQPPSASERFLGFLIRILPKIGPLRVLQFRAPTPETERLFEASFNATLDRYKNLLSQEAAGTLVLPNDNFDTGDVTGPGQYKLSDQAYAQLLDMHAKQNFNGITPEIRASLLAFYSDPNAPYTTKQKPKEWTKVQAELAQLKMTATSAN